MPKPTINFVTSNPGKVKEFKQIQEEHPEININVSVAPDLTSVNYSVTQNNL